MKTLKNRTLLLLLCLLPGCGRQLVEFSDPETDAGVSDTGMTSSDTDTVDITSTDTLDTDTLGTDTTGAETTDTDTLGTDTLGTGVTDLDGGILDTDTLGADILDLDSGLLGTDTLDTDTLGTGTLGTGIIDLDGGILDAGTLDAGLDAGTLDAGDLPSACGQAPVVLGAADDFVVLAGSTVTSTGPTLVTGDLGVSPGTAVIGFPPGAVVGNQHVGDPTAAQGVADLTTAYNDAAGRALCAVTISGNIGGMTLTPGLYKSTSSLEISSGDLTLDAQGDPDAVFIFQVASTLTTTSGRQVILSGGAKSTNIFWQVGTSATLGSTSAFQGTLMADQAITMETGATLNGRVLARIAAVSLDSNTIVKPAP